MSQGYCPVHGAFFNCNYSAHAQTLQHIPYGIQDRSYPLLSPFSSPRRVPTGWHPYGPFSVPVASDIEGMDEDEDDADYEEEEDQSESDWSETDSQQSTSVTTVSDNSTIFDDNDDEIEWAYDSTLELETLEDLRGSFGVELVDPSAWTLQRFIVLTGANDEVETRQRVGHWYASVAEQTGTPLGEPLRLPPVTRLGNFPFHRLITWKEANLFVGEARESCFGKEVDEEHKLAARLSIEFLVPGVRNNGLSAGDKQRIFAVASTVWTISRSAAEGLLWVMDNEYADTREEVEREWVNPKSEEFMVYTVLFPPPLVPTVN